MKLSSGLLLAISAQAIVKNITVYHVNPHEFGAIPVNMDTGDAVGDLFFDLEEVLIAPLACADPAHEAHGCANQEAVAPNLVVNKLTLEIVGGFSDAYAKCNIGVNGTDGHGNACEDGTYCCYCMDEWDRVFPCDDTVGRQNLYDHYASNNTSGRRHDFCHVGSKPSECYDAHVLKKLSPEKPGYWYSTLKEQYGKHWRVASVEKIVTRECHVRVGHVVQASAPGCFDACGDQARNTSSPCWVDCFYKAALGPDSGRYGGAVAGMAMDDLVAAWEKPFLPEDQGGCPPQAELPSPWLY
jgi:hypothetical protein